MSVLDTIRRGVRRRGGTTDSPISSTETCHGILLMKKNRLAHKRASQQVRESEREKFTRHPVLMGKSEVFNSQKQRPFSFVATLSLRNKGSVPYGQVPRAPVLTIANGSLTICSKLVCRRSELPPLERQKAPQSLGCVEPSFRPVFCCCRFLSLNLVFRTAS